jgi:hypothetical protein
MAALGDILLILLVGEIFLYGAAQVRIYQYAEERGLVPLWWWQKLISLIAPWDVIIIYIKDTKKESGHVGLWFKLLVASFLSLVITTAALAVLSGMGN